MIDEQPLFEFESHISGKNATVRIFSDRVEWGRAAGGLSFGKITAGLLTGGATLAVTGVGRGSYSLGKMDDSQMLPITAITSVSTKKDGRFAIVSISTPSGLMELRAKHREAEQAKRVLTELILRRNSPTPVVVATSPAPVGSTGPSLEELAAMYQSGILTEEEFTAAKRKLLGI